MKHSRFLCILVRGPPINKGVFTGFQPRKDALFLFPDHSALVAQWIEHRVRTQGVVGSSPIKRARIAGQES
jgi:hypothetical protein